MGLVSKQAPKMSQCRRKPKWGPELQQLAFNFLATFFSRHPPEHQPSYRFRRLLLMQFCSFHVFICMGPFSSPF